MEPLFIYLQVKYDNSPEFTPKPLNQLWQELCFGKSIFCSSITAGSLDGGGWKRKALKKALKTLKPSSLTRWNDESLGFSPTFTPVFLSKKIDGPSLPSSVAIENGIRLVEVKSWDEPLQMVVCMSNDPSCPFQYSHFLTCGADRLTYP